MKYRELRGYNFELLEPEIRNVELPNAYHSYMFIQDITLGIKPRYAWDGSSIPLKKWYRRIWDADKYCKTASLVHDALCQLMREDLLDKKYKEYIDGLYRDMCIQGGMGKREANLRYWFLRKFGDRGIRKEKNPRGKVFEI